MSIVIAQNLWQKSNVVTFFSSLLLSLWAKTLIFTYYWTKWTEDFVTLTQKSLIQRSKELIIVWETYSPTLSTIMIT